MRAWKEDLNFRQLVLADKEITAKIPRQQIEYAFDLPRQLKNIDRIFARVFPNPGASRTKSKVRARSSRTRTHR
jgi:adenylosuccinate lyase